MAELADALDLGSSSSECRFDSCYPHGKSRRVAILVGFRLLFLGSGILFVIPLTQLIKPLYHLALFGWE